MLSWLRSWWPLRRSVRTVRDIDPLNLGKLNFHLPTDSSYACKITPWDDSTADIMGDIKRYMRANLPELILPRAGARPTQVIFDELDKPWIFPPLDLVPAHTYVATVKAMGYDPCPAERSSLLDYLAWKHQELLLVWPLHLSLQANDPRAMAMRITGASA